MTCPKCGQAAEFKRHQPRTLETVLGPMRFRRAYYYCHRCGQGYAPFDDAAGLSRRPLTPGTKQLAALAGTLGDGFEEAALTILPRLSGLHLGESTVERVTEEAGQRLGKQLAEGRTFGKRQVWDWHTDVQGRKVAYVAIDAVSVRQQGPQAAAAASRMPYVAMVFNPRSLKARHTATAGKQTAAAPTQTEMGGEPPSPAPGATPLVLELADKAAVPESAEPSLVELAEAVRAEATEKSVRPPDKRPRMQARYLAGLYELPELGLQLRRQAAQVGMEEAEVWLGLSDGGNGLEDFVRNNFARIDIQVILDFWHPAEDLGELARLWHPGDEEAAQQQAQLWCHTMKHKGGQVILEELQALTAPKRKEVADRLSEVIGYIQNNVHRMDYPYYLSQGWFIGSGPVESACKTVVAARMKLAGMRWGEDGTDAVCHLRALFKSGPEQWDAFWQRSLN